jgi:chromosome segregation ATPase
MNRNPLCLVIIIFALVIPLSAGRADDSAQSTTESRLRDALRNTMQQLQDAQGQVATLQATQAQSDKDNAGLKAKVDALHAQIASLTKQSSDDKAASDKAMADLKQASQDLTTEMVDTLSIQINLLNRPGADDKATLEKSIADMKSRSPDLGKALSQYGTDIQLWKTGYYQYVQYGAQTEAARTKLAAEVIMLRRVIDDRETKNLELFDTAGEILTRYEKFSFGDALSAKEPFVGLTRAKLQEFVQDYKDKILADKIKIGQPPALIAQGPSSAGTAPPPPAKAAGSAKP